MNTTITAIATAPGRGAIAIIRVSGPLVVKAFKNLTKSTTIPLPNVIMPIWIYHIGIKLDHSMIVYFKAPQSFTGEEMIEIHCHGSRVVQDQILRVLFDMNIEPAKPGEFSKRAYYNGKIDLSQAEAIMELVSAENSQIAKLATRQLAGEFSKNINHIRDDITMLSSAIAADMDFSEEDTPTVSKEQIAIKLAEFNNKLNLIKANSEILPKLHQGVHIALVGLPNAGKSTLLNKLLGYQRSIVTDIAGTTRDTISESIEIAGMHYHFTDTAGLNSTPDAIEKIGIQKTIEAIKGADIILLLIAPGTELATTKFIAQHQLAKWLDNTKTITVHTKSDILDSHKTAHSRGKSTGKLNISATTGKGIDKLISTITAISSNKAYGDMQVLTERQVNILSRAEQIVVGIIDNLPTLSHDIVSSELESAVAELNELSGEHANQQIIDSIFRNFCIGK